MPPTPQSPLRPNPASLRPKVALCVALCVVTVGVLQLGGGDTIATAISTHPPFDIPNGGQQTIKTPALTHRSPLPDTESATGDTVQRIGIQEAPSSINGQVINEATIDSSGSEMARFRLASFQALEEGSLEVGLQVAGRSLPYPSRTKGRSLDNEDGEAQPIPAKFAPLLASHCPRNRFLTVNTHTWGRHHNQLQEIMNTITWAERLNRTAIISYFRYSHAWHTADLFYDFTEIKRRYCVVSHKEAEDLLSYRMNVQKLPTLTSRCLGQGMKGTKFKHLTGVARCPSKLDLPAHYNTRFAVRITKTMLNDYILPCTDGFLMLSGQMAFYMRPGLWENAMIFRHLLPSALVSAAVNSELAQRFFSSTKGSRSNFDESKNSFSTDPSDAAAVSQTLVKHQVSRLELRDAFPELVSDLRGTFIVYPYFSIHSRSREVDCLLEMSYDETDNAGFLTGMGLAEADDGQALAATNASALLAGHSPTWRKARGQCRITTELVDLVLKATRPREGTLLFLASDGQNAELEAAMAARGAIKVNNKFGGNALMAMAVDFFLMTSGLYFTGNQLSSVSQNVCYVRLGNGLTCDGWYPRWTMYHARNALSQTIPDPPAALK